jgi:hypothetical protein
MLVGTLECGEGDFAKSVESINAQCDIDVEHIVFSNMDEPSAHHALYSTWNRRKHEFDLFVKVDADIVLSNERVLKTFADVFESNHNITGVQAYLHDYYTDSMIFGITCINRVPVLNDAVDRLYCDRVDSGHNKIVRGNDLPKMLNPAGYHCHESSELQAFHFGLHRAKKKQHAVKSLVKQAYKQHNDRRRGLALIGFLVGETHTGDTSYRDIAIMYESCCQRYNELILRV